MGKSKWVLAVAGLAVVVFAALLALPATRPVTADGFRALADPWWRENQASDANAMVLDGIFLGYFAPPAPGQDSSAEERAAYAAHLVATMGGREEEGRDRLASLLAEHPENLTVRALALRSRKANEKEALEIASEGARLEPENAFWWVQALGAAHGLNQPATEWQMLLHAAAAKTWDDRRGAEEAGLVAAFDRRFGGATAFDRANAHNSVTDIGIWHLLRLQRSMVGADELRVRACWLRVGNTMMAFGRPAIVRADGALVVRRSIQGRRRRAGPSWDDARIEAKAASLDAEAKAKGLPTGFVESARTANAIHAEPWQLSCFPADEFMQRVVWRRLFGVAVLFTLLLLPGFGAAALARRLPRKRWSAPAAAALVAGGGIAVFPTTTASALAGLVVAAVLVGFALARRAAAARIGGWLCVTMCALGGVAVVVVFGDDMAWARLAASVVVLAAYLRLDALAWPKDVGKGESWTNELAALLVPLGVAIAWVLSAWQAEAPLAWLAVVAALLVAELVLASPKARLRFGAAAGGMAFGLALCLVSLAALVRIDGQIRSAYDAVLAEDATIDQVYRDAVLRAKALPPRNANN